MNINNSEIFALTENFIASGLLALLFIAGAISARNLVNSNTGRVLHHTVTVVGLLIIVVFPHGWNAVFGEAWQEKHALVKHSALWAADFAGVIVATTITYAFRVFSLRAGTIFKTRNSK